MASKTDLLDGARALLTHASLWDVALPPPGGLTGLHALASRFSLRRGHREALKTPAQTVRDGGGDWDEIILVLACAARHAGIATRIEDIDASMHLQARENEASEWESVGPPGYLRQGTGC